MGCVQEATGNNSVLEFRKARLSVYSCPPNGGFPLLPLEARNRTKRENHDILFIQSHVLLHIQHTQKGLAL